MRILGIDPGTGIMGFGVIDSGHQPKMVDAGVIRTKVHQPEPERLVIIYDALQEIVKLNKPQAVSVEKLFFARNVTTAMSVAQARGIVLLVAQQHNLPIHEYTPMQIKQTITGYGKADKKQMQEMVRMLLKLKEAPKPDDCADALAAALTYAAHAHIS
jgi:crossover junction endodeoxyribonuclease RuvC